MIFTWNPEPTAAAAEKKGVPTAALPFFDRTDQSITHLSFSSMIDLKSSGMTVFFSE